MRLRFAVLLVTIAACSDSPTSVRIAERGTWGSSAASLTTTDTGATLNIVASGDCIGSYGDVAQPIPAGAFTLAGTYTQLMGAYPGKVVHPAQFTGTAIGNTVTVTIVVPETQQTVGPFTVTYGVRAERGFCLYP